jgi:amino-acid N-acetyltransferase
MEWRKKEEERNSSMIRKAVIQDVKEIQALINGFAKDELMLARSLNELYDNIRDFWVCEKNKSIYGCCALHICWQDLAEIKSLAVRAQSHKKGIGTELVNVCIAEAKMLGAKKLFALTYAPGFFLRLGFHKVKHAALPHKVWAECINCPKFPNCKEIALVKNL